MPRAFLKIVAGTRSGTNVPLQDSAPLVVGRTRGDLVLDDPMVSGRHMQLLWRDGAWWLQDLKSTNGTMVDGQLVRDVVSRLLERSLTVLQQNGGGQMGAAGSGPDALAEE